MYFIDMFLFYNCVFHFSIRRELFVLLERSLFLLSCLCLNNARVILTEMRNMAFQRSNKSKYK